MPDQGLPNDEISSLSDSQERILSCLTIISSCLSIMGSSMIVYLVQKSSRKTPYKRILLGLSLADIVASLSWALSPFLLPVASSQRVWARGTDATCMFLGFLTQLSFIAIWYNGMLSFYYLLTVRYRVSATTFATRYEPWVHVLSIGYNVIAGIVGYAKGYYSEMELGQGCFIAEYPDGCEINGGCTGAIIGWITSGAAAVIFFFSILINNLIIYCHVRKTTNRTINKSFQGRAPQHRRIQAVATQAFLYVATFLVAYVWAFAIRVAESLGFQAADEARLYPILVLSSIFLPLQGVFNLFVYSRPNYLRVRHIYPKESKIFALKQVWFGKDNGAISTVDGNTLKSRNVHNSIASTKGAILNVEQVRLRVSQQFSATFSRKDPLRRDIRMRDNNLMEGSSSDGRASWNREQNSSRESSEAPQMSQTAHGQSDSVDRGIHIPPNLVMMDDGDSRLGESQVGSNPMMSSEVETPLTFAPLNLVPREVSTAVDDPDEAIYEDYMSSVDSDRDSSSKTDMMDVSNR